MKNTKQTEVLGKLQKIENLLEKKKYQPLNTLEASKYLAISISHLYKLTSQRKIPFHKPNGKHLYFFIDELNEWITSTSLNDKTMRTLSKQNSNENILIDEENEPP
jgi:excisionase family DNA binding protein